MVERKRKKIRRKYVIKSADDFTTAKDKVRQLIQAKAQRVIRIEKRGKQFRQNRTFVTDNKRFYQELGKKQIGINKSPTA